MMQRESKQWNIKPLLFGAAVGVVLGTAYLLFNPKVNQSQTPPQQAVNEVEEIAIATPPNPVTFDNSQVSQEEVKVQLNTNEPQKELGTQ